MKEVDIKCKVRRSRITSIEKVNVGEKDKIFSLKKQLVDLRAKIGSWRRSLLGANKC